MKKTFKKITASVIAVASLAVSMVGMSASAVDGSGTVGEGKKSLSVASTSIYATTKATASQYLYVQVYKVTGTINSGNYSMSSYTRTDVYASLSGTNITQAWSTHTVGATTGTLTVSR